MRYGSHAETWIETGTYLGHTTSWLAKQADKVISIEPDQRLAQRAQRKVSANHRITILKGYSEELLGPVLNDVTGKVSFWLDGHFSGGVTAIGTTVTPIIHELHVIGAVLKKFEQVSIFIDDSRLFGDGIHAKNGYPPREALVTWAREHEMNWTIEHDIFVMTSLNHLDA
jgi:hypothetical protein